MLFSELRKGIPSSRLMHRERRLDFVPWWLPQLGAQTQGTARQLFRGLSPGEATEGDVRKIMHGL